MCDGKWKVDVRNEGKDVDIGRRHSQTSSFLTHSSCSSFRIAGILVAEGGRGLIKGLAVNW